MKIRIEGLKSELNVAVEKLNQNFIIHSTSKPYKNRKSDYHRVYLDVEIRKE